MKADFVSKSPEKVGLKFSLTEVSCVLLLLSELDKELALC